MDIFEQRAFQLTEKARAWALRQKCAWLVSETTRRPLWLKLSKSKSKWR